MTKLSPLAITGIVVGSLIGGGILYSLTKSKSKKPAQFPDSNSDALKEARETLSSVVPEVSRSEIISAIQESSDSFFKKGGSRRRCKKGGKRKTKGKGRK
jgi:hypothetical protein